MPHVSANKSNFISSLWDNLGRLRFLLCLAVLFNSFADPHIISKRQVWILIAIYSVFNFSLRRFGSSILYLKRVRVLPALADVVFVSLIVHNSTGTDNSWFLFYLFPIISVSRYLAPWGTLSVALCSVASYLLIYTVSPSDTVIDPRWLIMRCLVLICVGALAVNLASARQKELIKLTEFHGEIDQAILNETDLGRVLNLILRKSLEFTNSGMGHIRLLNDTTRDYQIVTAIGHPDDYDPGLRSFDDDISHQVINLGEPVIIPQIRRWHLRRNLDTYFTLRHPRPKSALFVPLKLQSGVIGIVAVYSRWSHHFTKVDARRLTTFTPLIEMAIKTVESAERLKKQQTAERYYRNLIDNSPDPIIVLDKRGKIIVFNKACQQLWGFTEKEVMGKSVVHYYATPEHAIEIGTEMNSRQENRVQNYEARIKAKNHEIIPISLSACFVKDQNGERDGSIGVFKDRRDAIKLEDKMLRAERLAVVGRLAATVGHNIMHNIATAMNQVEILLLKCAPEQEPRLNKINSALRKSVDQFRDLLRAHQPKLPQKAEITVKEIFQVVEERMRKRALDENITFEINCPQEDYRVSVDIEQISDVLFNLFTNSLHAIEKRAETDSKFTVGLIQVSAHPNRDDLQIIWQDNGCGISKDISKSLFNAFVTNKGKKGTGLGLFIAKSVIENHDGHIDVVLKPGEGAVFRITFPLLKTRQMELPTDEERL